MSEQWWFNLRTSQVEQGDGDPNSQRLGPYDSQEQAQGALDRIRARNEDLAVDED